MFANNYIDKDKRLSIICKKKIYVNKTVAQSLLGRTKKFLAELNNEYRVIIYSHVVLLKQIYIVFMGDA